MKLSKAIILTTLLFSFFLTSTAFAGAESGVYVGAGAGNSNIEGPIGSSTFDTDLTGYKLILGYNFGLVPLIDAAIEGSYVDMGKESTGGIEYSQTSFNGFGLLGLSLGPFGLFAKAGIASWEGETTIGGLKSTESGTDPVYGVGVRLHILHVTGRLEYEYYEQSNFDDVSNDDLLFV
jgi:opacity protein-like surface antigen